MEPPRAFSLKGEQGGMVSGALGMKKTHASEISNSRERESEHNLVRYALLEEGAWSTPDGEAPGGKCLVPLCPPDVLLNGHGCVEPGEI